MQRRHARDRILVLVETAGDPCGFVGRPEMYRAPRGRLLELEIPLTAKEDCMVDNETIHRVAGWQVFLR